MLEAQRQLISRLPPNTYIRPIQPLQRQSLWQQVSQGYKQGAENNWVTKQANKAKTLAKENPKTAAAALASASAAALSQGLELQTGLQSQHDRATIKNALGANWRDVSFEIHPTGYINKLVADWFAKTGTELRPYKDLNLKLGSKVDTGDDLGPDGMPFRPTMDAKMRAAGLIK